MRARAKAAAHNLAVFRHIALNLIQLEPDKRKGSIKTRRINAATSDRYRAELLQGPVKVRQLKQSKESLSWYWLFLKNLANLGS
jgi:hypothetical protein